MDLFESLKTYLSEKEIKELKEALEKESLHAALLNPTKISDEKFVELFPHVKPHPIVKHAFIYDKNEYELGKHVLHELGAYYLQEPSAMLPAFLLNPNKDDMVLDLCAAPGGKSVQASFLMENQGFILSNDISRSRALAILENTERLGIANIGIISRDFKEIYQDLRNYFTKIILDAPCSGSGMFRKSEAVKDDWSYEKVLRCQKIQKELILMAYQMLAPNGEMVYSTCSFSKEEDEDVVKYLLDNTDAEIIKIPSNPLYYEGKDGLGIHLFPHLFPGEGHYICLIKKPNVGERRQIKTPKFVPYKLDMDFEGFQPYTFNDHALLVRKEGMNFIDYKYLVRVGLEVLELSNKRISRYGVGFAHFIHSFGCGYSLSKEEVRRYLSGEGLTNPKTIQKGFVWLTYMGLGVDIAYFDGKMIKNHYPKHLRKLIQKF